MTEFEKAKDAPKTAQDLMADLMPKADQLKSPAKKEETPTEIFKEVKDMEAFKKNFPIQAEELDQLMQKAQNGDWKDSLVVVKTDRWNEPNGEMREQKFQAIAGSKIGEYTVSMTNEYVIDTGTSKK